MLGGLGSYIASEVSGAVRRNLIVYGLFGFGALLVLCAGGYGLGALHMVLALRHGAVAASLWIAGGLLLSGAISVGVALYVKTRRRPARPLAKTALFAAPLAAKVLGSTLLGSKRGWRTLALGGVIVLGALLGRQVFGGDADAEKDDA